ncbi:hypothetical protein [Arthrobacter mobilis]|uniref:Uncharacterized protein n=1 Tax=Arthrobacter mobilis TaxID=2724944 RepID=A0A7X6HGE7_9MICC|nr:hypothetical protein [Arthrobacter mobilis]NKX55683.1 hypothetical protein [Arthrobacter mobilis]
MSNYRPQRPSQNGGGMPRIDWRGTLWAMLAVFLLSYLLIFLFPGMHPVLRIIVVLGLYFGGRYAWRRYRRQRR